MQVLRDGNNKIAGKFQVVYAQAPLDCLPQRQIHRIWKSSMLSPLTQKPNLYCLNQNNLRINKINKMKKTRIVYMIVATALVAGTVMFTSCEKEGSNENVSLVQTKAAEDDYPCGQRPHIQGSYNPGLTVLCSDGLPDYCDYTKPGNCLKEIKAQLSSTQLDMAVSGGPSSVGKLFSGEEWKRFWPNLDSKIVAELATGKYYLHKRLRSGNECFYVATKSSKLAAGIDIYLVMPVIYE